MGKAAPSRMEARACRCPLRSLEEEEEAVMRRQALRSWRVVGKARRLLEKMVVACLEDGGLSGTRRAWVRVVARRRRRTGRRGGGGEVVVAFISCRPCPRGGKGGMISQGGA